MDGVIFGLISPLIIKEFAPRHSDLSDRFPNLAPPRHHRASFLAVALRPGRPPHAAGRQYLNFFADDADRGAVPELRCFCRSTRASNVCAQRGVVSGIDARRRDVARAHLRGRVISINRATWCFGASFAGAITGLVAGTWGWRAAVMVPGVIALLAIYVRATCPKITLLGPRPGQEAPHRGHTRRRRSHEPRRPGLVQQGR